MILYMIIYTKLYYRVFIYIQGVPREFRHCT